MAENRKRDAQEAVAVLAGALDLDVPSIDSLVEYAKHAADEIRRQREIQAKVTSQLATANAALLQYKQTEPQRARQAEREAEDMAFKKRLCAALLISHNQPDLALIMDIAKRASYSDGFERAVLLVAKKK